MRKYVFECFAAKKGYGDCQLFNSLNAAIETGKAYYNHLTEKEKAALTLCHVYEIEASPEQIEDINDGSDVPYFYKTNDVWDALEKEEIFMQTLDYVGSEIQDVEIGGLYYFGQLWDGDGGNQEGLDILDSGCVSPDDEHVVDFVVIGKINSDDAMDTLVQVIDIY